MRLAKQLPLFPEYPATQPVVNVASVPQRSPFRYPGGKTWLVPVIRRWLGTFPQKPFELIEPFAGGAIVGLTAAFEQLVEHVTLVELDAQVAAVWHTIINDNDGDWLARQVETFDLTPDRVQALLEQTELPVREQALQTIVKNRVNRGGILAPGAGKLKLGESGKGLTSRWYPQTLKQRILHISAIRERLTFIHGDGLTVLRQTAPQPGYVYFIDPPYTAEGKRPGNRLYLHHDLNHDELFSIARALTGDFLMTYDDNDRIRTLASEYGFDTRSLPMKNTHHAHLTELMVGRDLSWIP